MSQSWGFWSRYKLELLRLYLEAFTTTTKNRSKKCVYLDLFGGDPDNVERDTLLPIDGSAKIALDITDPPFTHLRFFEKEPRASRLGDKLQADYPGRDVIVYSGDCNETIGQALADLHSADAGWAPTFAFLDPTGPHYQWTTLEKLARHKGVKAKTKVELWILFPDPLFMRMLPKSGELRTSDNETITAMYGTPQWHAIFTARLTEQITPKEAREEYVNLMRWRLERVLGYRSTHQLEIYNASGVPLYHMVFATDSKAGNDIMASLYNRAANEFPDMAKQAKMQRQRKRREATGQFDLFSAAGQPEPSATQPGRTGKPRKLYKHTPPDEPREHNDGTCQYCS